MTKSGITSYGDGQSGVTLVEIIVALAVIALTLAIAASGFRLLARSGDRGAQVIARHDVLSRGIDVLRRDIERLERAVWKRGDKPEFVFHGDATSLIFVVVEPPFPSEAGPYFIVYAVLQQGDGAVLTRSRAPFDTSVADIQRLPTEDAVAVIEGRYQLRFRYLDRKDGQARWLSQWPDRHSLPELIRLDVIEGSGPMPPILFRPRVDAERSCVKDGSSCTIGTRGVLATESN
jgi:prepilin-type N-terminal cleavage/methylation domain-containing protein